MKACFKKAAAVTAAGTMAMLLATGCSAPAPAVDAVKADVACEAVMEGQLAFDPRDYGEIVRTAGDGSDGSAYIQLKLNDAAAKAALEEIARANLGEPVDADEIGFPPLGGIPGGKELKAALDGMETDALYTGIFGGQNHESISYFMAFVHDGAGADYLFYVQ